MRPALLLALAALTSLDAAVAIPEPRAGPDTSLAAAIEAHGACRPSIRVVKSARRLEARCGEQVVKTYVVNLGSASEGDKEREGDRRTPEGRFTVCNRNRRSQFHRFLGLSYPAADDAARGEAAGLVTTAQRRAIEAALARGTCPPWGTALGGAVGIHGNGGFTRVPGRVLLHDWTWGCVAVRDTDIEELWDFAPVGTPVEIVP